ncbi:hypothetical protein BKA65DRAFT_520672 [Rhexocercosporidium sp. MPI-PUGE-AT-0058]|nr:hypothetical protein BKA65DRAFT_520672 [Rhexocercosporidium sp. MPI-PUGE-AT-0058]
MQNVADAEAKRFAKSCAEAAKYPNNLLYDDSYDHTRKGYSDRLDDQEERLFFDESKASMCLRDFDEKEKCFENVVLHNNADLKDYLIGANLLDRCDPQCRFVFVHAPHSRERLKITKAMFLFTMTYHQVIPAFLDFVFPFGKQEYCQDFQFSGFRSDDRLAVIDRGLELPQIGRSGRDIRMCYNLKSVEPSNGQKQWPWSIRQIAMYHSFDIETGKAFWLIVKGDQLMKKRIEAATSSRYSGKLQVLDAFATSFSSTLQNHLIIFDWCREHWRWYINFIEQELQKVTREALLVDLDRDVNYIERTPCQLRASEAISLPTCISPASVWEKAPWRFISQLSHHPTGFFHSTQQASTPRPSSSSANSEDSLETSEDFSFSDLQEVQSLEEKANEAGLVLESNINTLSEVRQHYGEVVNSEEFPAVVKAACSREIYKFEKTQSRTKVLLRLLTDRKSLLYGILDYRNMESNKLFASKAQISAQNVEVLTRDMHEIAQKTKQETVSMRIITLVTLFFLPGTFISTIMSTDIVKYQKSENGKSQEVFQLGALQLYLAITLPLMFLTFASWYGVYIWVDRKEKANVLKKRVKTGV